MRHVVCVLKTNQGGLWVLPQLREIRRRGHRITVIIPPGTGRLRQDLDSQGFSVVDSPFDFSFKPTPSALKGLLNLRRLLRELAPDVHFYHLYASALATRFATVGLPGKRVHMVAGPLYLESWPIRQVERVLCRMDDVVIGGSSHTARLYQRLGYPADRLRAIPYGADLQKFQPAPDSRFQLLGLEQSTFVGIMVAYVYPPHRGVHRNRGIKGHDLLIAAWAEFTRKHENVHLVLVGGGFGSEGDRLKRSLEAMASRMLGTGYTWVDTTSDVRRYYASADVSISPSLSENHGAAVEASAMGLPSIVSDAGALPETVEHGRTGWITPAGDVDALVAALEAAHSAWDDSRLRQMGSAARDKIRQEMDQARTAAEVAEVVLSAR